MRVYVAGLRTETNSFVARPTAYADFMAGDLTPSGERPASGRHPGFDRFVAEAEAMGLEVKAGLAAYAIPGGPVRSDCYRKLRDMVLEPLASGGRFDLVLLDLHGAMASVDLDDCEGDLLRAVREHVGPQTVVGALLDPHASLSDDMIEHATLLHAYKEYPHTDVADRAGELFRLALASAQGRVAPVVASSEVRVLGGFPTTREPMRSFVDWLKALEARPGVLAASLIHGFPWSDTHANGAKALIYTDGDPALAQALADDVAARFRSLAPQAVEPMFDIKAGLDALRKRQDERIALADASDNPGGGADGDATYLLRALQSGSFEGVGAALIFDPQALAQCQSLGEGAAIEAELGGKASAYSGVPLRVSGHVAGLADSVTAGSARAPGPSTGPVARIRTSWADLLVCGRRREALWPELFTATGADPRQYRVLVLKSSNHFRAGFEPIVDRIISIGSPTAMNPDLRSLPFKRLSRPMWPLDDSEATNIPR